MRANLVAMLAVGGVLSACASAGSTSHGAMSHGELMRRCESMDRSAGQHRQTAQDQSPHDSAQHGSMSHSRRNDTHEAPPSREVSAIIQTLYDLSCSV